MRQRFGGDVSVSDASLVALRADPRRGAREIAERLDRRRERGEAERRRVEVLWREERMLRPAGSCRTAGVDEVGMGPLAGPVVAAAVILPEGAHFDGLRDSKRLTPAARARLAAEVRSVARSVSIGVTSRVEIDRINIYQAGLLAMRRAVLGLRPGADGLLVDARRIPDLKLPQRAVIGGDDRVASISAASIVAKVYRDTLMCELDSIHPGYGFAHNRGYGTAEHLEALQRLGPSSAHRRSFAPVTRLLRRRAPGGV
ncbi:MAG: ribonuclease HII [Deltaproteobacteria bacterium]|nr:ribonuclease HII [Deltaproteobacteria bacterium]